jgi:hypothetical protein
MHKYFILKIISKLSKIPNQYGISCFIFLVFGLSIAFIIGCTENSVITNVLPGIGIISPVAMQKQNTADNFARLLALDLNENDAHRREIFTKVAVKYDGDLEIILSNLNTKTLDEFQSFSKGIITGSKLKKSSASQSSIPFLKLKQMIY